MAQRNRNFNNNNRNYAPSNFSGRQNTSQVIAPGSISPGLCSIYELSVKKKSVVFRYDVSIIKEYPPKEGSTEIPPRNMVELVKPNLASKFRVAFRQLINLAFVGTFNFGVKDASYVYDGRKILYSTKELKTLEFTILQPAFTNDITDVFGIVANAHVILAPNDAFKLDYSNFEAASSVTGDQSVTVFLEMLTTNALVQNSETFFANGRHIVYNKKRSKDLFAGLESIEGFKKGIYISKNSKDEIRPVMATDMQKSLFYVSEKLSDVYTRCRNGRIPFTELMKNVTVAVNYKKGRFLTFKSLTVKPIGELIIKYDDKTKKDDTVVAYFLKEKGLKVDPTFPAMICRAEPNSYFPMDHLSIVSGQVCSLKTREMSSILIKENVISPNDRYSIIHSFVKNLSESPFIGKFGVSINVNSNPIKIKRLDRPKPIYGSNSVIRVEPEGTWLSATKRFLLPPPIEVNVLVNNQRNYRHDKDIEKFIKRFESGLIEKGVKVKFTRFVGTLEEAAKVCDKKYHLLFYIDEENVPEQHSMLKTIEATQQILTQQIATRSLLDEGKTTLWNLMAKFNSKCFGVNNTVECPSLIKDIAMEKNDVIYIGYDLAHPSQMSASEKKELELYNEKNGTKLKHIHPSVVGICASSETHGFCGDFFYQTRDDDIVDATLLENKISRFVAISRRKPKTVIIFRDGLSEGQMKRAITQEASAIRRGIKKVVPNLDPKLVFLGGTKDHNKRFFRGENVENLNNTGAADFIISENERNDIKQIYFQSHKTIKGCSKIPQFELLINELSLTKDKIINICSYLSSIHQTCASPTSLPEPIFIAHNAAKRGLELYNYYCKMVKNNSTNSIFDNPPYYPESKILDVNKMTSLFNYEDKKLEKSHFYA